MPNRHAAHLVEAKLPWNRDQDKVSVPSVVPGGPGRRLQLPRARDMLGGLEFTALQAPRGQW